MSEWKSMNHQSTMSCLNELDPSSQASQSLLFEVCTQSPFDDARWAAIEKLHNPSLLVKVARHEPDQDLCKAAIEKLADDNSLLEVAEYIYDDHYLCSIAIKRIGDPEMLFHIAQSHAYIECRIAAVKRLEDQASLHDVARQNSNPEVRVSAIEALTDQQKLAEIVEHDPSSWVRHSAIGRLTDPGCLADIARNNDMHTMRLAALIRLLEIERKSPISPEIIEGLLPLMDNSATVEPVIELAKKADVDWVSKSNQATVQALFVALSADKGWHNSIAMEQAVKELYHARLDLREALLSYHWIDPDTNSALILS